MVRLKKAISVWHTWYFNEHKAHKKIIFAVDKTVNGGQIMITISRTHCASFTRSYYEQILRWYIAPIPIMARKQSRHKFYNSRFCALVVLFECERTPALNDWGSAGCCFDLCDSLSASMGVALIIPLLNSCFLAHPGSCPGIMQWAKS